MTSLTSTRRRKLESVAAIMNITSTSVASQTKDKSNDKLAAFQLFPRLPPKLQVEIFTLHALSSVVPYPSGWLSFKSPPGHVSCIPRLTFAQNTLFLVISDRNCLTPSNKDGTPRNWRLARHCKKIHLPATRQVNRLARDTLFDVLKRLIPWDFFYAGLVWVQGGHMLDFRFPLQPSTSTFDPFPRLPKSLQINIFKRHALSTITPNGNLLGPPGHITELEIIRKNKRSQDLVLKFEAHICCHIPCCMARHLPAGLRTCHSARGVTMGVMEDCLSEVKHHGRSSQCKWDLEGLMTAMPS